MKKLLVAATLLITMSCMAQKNIPAAVVAAFSKSFPGVKTSWDKEDGTYEANFKKDGKTMSASYDEKGTWVETETDIALSDLPATITNYIAANYAGAKIKEAAMLKRPAGDMYEAEVNGKDLLFDMKGKFVKAVKD